MRSPQSPASLKLISSLSLPCYPGSTEYIVSLEFGSDATTKLRDCINKQGKCRVSPHGILWYQQNLFETWSQAHACLRYSGKQPQLQDSGKCSLYKKFTTSSEERTNTYESINQPPRTVSRNQPR